MTFLMSESWGTGSQTKVSKGAEQKLRPNLTLQLPLIQHTTSFPVSHTYPISLQLSSHWGAYPFQACDRPIESEVVRVEKRRRRAKANVQRTLIGCRTNYIKIDLNKMSKILLVTLLRTV